MDQGTQGYCLSKKTEGRKSHDTVSLYFTFREAKILAIEFFPL
jgi:hypothetical protein